jgi:predicted transcriptional regulator of viral defense system
MNRADVIMDLVKGGNGIVTSRQVTESGIHRQYLTELVKKDNLELVERGVYIDPNALPDTLYNLQSRYGKGIFSRGTARYLFITCRREHRLNTR